MRIFLTNMVSIGGDVIRTLGLKFQPLPILGSSDFVRLAYLD